MPDVRACALGSVIGLAALSIVPAGLRAQSANWTNTAGGTFSTGGNWSTLSVPGPADTATFDSAGVYQVDFTAPWTNAAASFGATSGEITLALAGRHWTIAGDAAFGAAAGTAGGVIVDGGNLYVGNFMNFTGTGSGHAFTVQNGARVESTNIAYIGTSGSGKTFTVNGAGSQLIGPHASQWGNGGAYHRLVVTNAGYLQLGSLAQYGSFNEILITGPGSTFICPDHRNASSRHSIGATISNRLTVANGALMSPRHNWTWQNAGMKDFTFRVTGSGSMMSNDTTYGNGQIYITEGTGRMVADNGGRILLNGMNIHQGTKPIGITIRCQDPGSQIIMGSFYTSFTGALHEAAGVVVSNQGYIQCGGLFHGQGGDGEISSMLVSGTGSVLNATSWVRCGIGATHFNTARIRIRDGGRITSPTWSIGYDAGSTGVLEVTGADAVMHAGGTLYAGLNGIGFVGVDNKARIHASYMTLGHVPANSSNNQVNVYDGSVLITNTVTVKDGTISMIGTGGVCEAGQNLVLEAAGGLRFVAAAGGVSPVTVKGALQVDGASTLELDMRAYRSEYGSSVVLASYGSMPAGFDESNITITGVEGYVDQVTGNKLTLRIQQGSLLMVR